MSKPKKKQAEPGVMAIPPEAWAPWPQYPLVQAPAPVPATYRSASASALVHNDAAVAEVSYNLTRPDGQSINVTGKGVSKREREDSADPITAEALAMSRAFAEASARLARIARSRTRAQDSERKQKAVRRTKAEWEALQLEDRIVAAEAKVAARLAAEDRIVEVRAREMSER
jgi:hypothetical protein